ncbi:MAG: uroporphyrinogen-III C-methyltransferase [Alphaproteobacteria bacterium]|nr:uroporphyrinogen-III C-methyltransferase [Alphaproteobacteria bacterium]
MDDIPTALPEFRPGAVWLVGAGPGDPGLLTLLALHALRHADVVVTDALVDPRILGLARPGAAIEPLGKRGGRPSPTQAEISARLVELAGRGLRVLRLKGGDPFLFGRGVDEALALGEAKIPYRVVPGVTAGIGGLAYAGIPATAGGTNSAVAFATGHGPSGELPDDVDWRALARGAPVLVVYMGLATLGRLRDELLAGGRSADEPAALVSRAATPRQRVVETTLGAIVEAAALSKIEAPALVVVGPVVALRRHLGWWDPQEQSE